MLYSPDSFGLGHLRRTVTLARHFRRRRPGGALLIVTGSPAPHVCRLPEGAEWIKLPSVVKVGKEKYESRVLPIGFEEIRDLRRDILLSSVRYFQPDALIVDHAPSGLKGELVPALRYLRKASPRTRLIAGIRDIVDEPWRVRRAWSVGGDYELLDQLYDRILVYGDESVYDVVAEYGFSNVAAAKTRYVGYLGPRPASRSVEDVRGGLGLETDRLVLVMAGGGGDGARIFRAVLAAHGHARGRADPLRQPFDCLLVGGPLMNEEQRRKLKLLVPSGAALRFEDSVDDLVDYVAAADVVISMGGYNSVCEILSFGRPAIVIPRVQPRKEQLMRARILSRRGLAELIHPDELTPRRLLETIDELLAHPVRASSSLRLDGLRRVDAELEQVLGWSAERLLVERARAARATAERSVSERATVTSARSAG